MGLYDPVLHRPTTLYQGFERSTVPAPDGSPMYAFAVGFGLDGWTHTGVDIRTVNGEPLYSPVAGTVIVAGADTAYTDKRIGMLRGSGLLKIRTAAGYDVILGHCAAHVMRVGETVTAGQLVAVSGEYYEPHVHLEVRVPDTSTAYKQVIVDPAMLFAARRTFKPVAPLMCRDGRSLTSRVLGSVTPDDVVPVASVTRDGRTGSAFRVGTQPDLWGLTAPTASVPNAWIYLPYTQEVHA